MPEYSATYVLLYDHLDRLAKSKPQMSMLFFAFYCPFFNFFSLLLLNLILYRERIEFVSKRTDKRPVHLIYNLFHLSDNMFLQKYFLYWMRLYAPFIGKELSFALQMSGVVILEDEPQAQKILSENERQPFLKTYRHYQMFTLFYQGRHDEILNIIKTIEDSDDDFSEFIVSINIPLSLGLSDELELSAYFYLAYFYEHPPLKVLEEGNFRQCYTAKLAAHLKTALAGRVSFAPNSQHAPRIGLFFFNQPKTLGHVLQDPFCFLSLYQEDYDEIYFIGEAEDNYDPACLAGLEIIKQYGTYLDVTDPFLTQLNWMNHGVFQIENVHVHIQNHWAFLREMESKNSDVLNPYQHGVWALDISVTSKEKGQEFAKEVHIDVSQPIVCLHIREHQYHQNNIQTHRNATVTHYIPAIDFLLKAGYQIIRIGDQKMSRLSFSTPGYFELPFLKGYDHWQDSFFIKQSAFMIGCQSGPCAYARSMGVPLLSVNAIFDYAHLPARQEMGCSRKLYQKTSNGPQYIPDLDVLGGEYFLIASAFQYESMELFFEEVTSGEIVAAIGDMLLWLQDEALPLTVGQVAFRKKAETINQRLKESPPVTPAIATFCSYSLPGYRISPSVEEMRKNNYAIAYRQS